MKEWALEQDVIVTELKTVGKFKAIFHTLHFKDEETRPHLGGRELGLDPNSSALKASAPQPWPPLFTPICQQEEPRLKNNSCSAGQDWRDTWSQEPWVGLLALSWLSCKQKFHLLLPFLICEMEAAIPAPMAPHPRPSRDQGRELL